MQKKILDYRYLFVVLIAVVVIGGMAWANTIFTRHSTLEKDFLVPWLGARTLLQYGVDPFSELAAQRAQIVYYGRLAEEGEDPLGLSIAMPVELFYIPFAMIDDYYLAMGLWMTLAELALVATGFLCFHLINWKPSTITRSVLLIGLLLWVYSFRLFIQASLGPWVFLGIVGVLVAIKNHRDDLAGALMALVLLAPALSLPFIIFIIFWTMQTKRWRLWWGFFVVVASTILFSFLIFPSWVLPFLRNVIASMAFMNNVTVGGLLTEWWPSIGKRLACPWPAAPA